MNFEHFQRKKKWALLTLVSIAFLLVSCDKDPEPVIDGNIALSPTSSVYQGPRGTQVLISVSAEAEDGIASLTALVADGTMQDMAIPTDATSFNAELTFEVPANALLGWRQKCFKNTSDCQCRLIYRSEYL